MLSEKRKKKREKRLKMLKIKENVEKETNYHMQTFANSTDKICKTREQ